VSHSKGNGLPPRCWSLEKEESVDMKTFEKIVELEHWQKIDKKFPVER
jgi:hypothetical protein